MHADQRVAGLPVFKGGQVTGIARPAGTCIPASDLRDQGDIAKVHEWLGHAGIATTRPL